MFFIQFIRLYWTYLSVIDWTILVLGVVVIGRQLREYRFLKRSSGNLINQDLCRAEDRAAKIIRLATLAIDGFPLLGLLGTVASLLVTFAGMKGPQITTNIIADFAPGLTSTVSGLICAITNLIVFQLLLVPAAMKLRNQRRSHG
jgi:biopolymer transport protein ExbB/TolQ